jgi:hypothetical protein
VTVAENASHQVHCDDAASVACGVVESATFVERKDIDDGGSDW